MTETTNRRPKNRTPTSLKTYYSFDLVEGVGALADVTYSGALIEGISTRPEIGKSIVLCVYLKSPVGYTKVAPFKLSGVVVRLSSTGFAIEYEDNHDPVVRGMLDVAAAIMAGRAKPLGPA